MGDGRNNAIFDAAAATIEAAGFTVIRDPIEGVDDESQRHERRVARRFDVPFSRAASSGLENGMLTRRTLRMIWVYQSIGRVS